MDAQRVVRMLERGYDEPVLQRSIDSTPARAGCVRLNPLHAACAASISALASPAALAVLAVFILGPLAKSQTLALRHYDVADGLSSSRVVSLYQDRKGYLWLGAWEGLCRFDGHEIVCFGSADGIESPVINAIVEDPQGNLWAATNGGGIVRFLDSNAATRSEARLKAFADYHIDAGPASNVVDALLFDAQGNLWCGTEAGLFEARAPIGSPPKFEAISSRRPDWPGALMQDRRGRVWVGSGEELLEIVDGRIAAHSVPREPALGECVGVSEDTDGSLVCAFDRGLRRLVPGPDVAAGAGGAGITGGAAEDVWRALPLALEDEQRIRAICPVAHDKVWIATTKGLVRWTPEGQFTYTMANGLSDDLIYSLLEDRDHNLWIGTWSGGVCKLVSESIVSFTTADGMPAHDALRLIDNRSGSILATTGRGTVEIGADGRDRLTIVPGSREPPFDRVGQRILQDRHGDFWIGTDVGLFRCPGPRLQFEKLESFGPEDGIPRTAIFSLISDARTGRIWIGMNDGPAFTLDEGRSDDESSGDDADRAHRDARARGDAPLRTDGARGDAPPRGDDRTDGKAPTNGEDRARGETRTQAEDRTHDERRTARPRFRPPPYGSDAPHLTPRVWFGTAGGSLWLAPYDGLWRYANKRMTEIDPLLAGTVNQARCFHQSADGELWIGTRFHGVSVTSEPEAEHPRFRNWSMENGLASDAVWSIAEDARGRIYLGTARGLDRLDPKSRRVHHITTAEGLAGDIVYHCLTDSRGFIWVATSNGVSRIDPTADEIEPAPPPVYIARVVLAGKDLPLPLSGAADVPLVTLSSADDNLRVDYRAVSLCSPHELSYQYRLESADRDWSEPTAERSVTYAQMAPGSYRFLVRALHTGGATSRLPASFAFTIPPPFWRTWWFLSLALIAAGSIALSLHRLRLRRVLALESIRRQIATDIHDDMGSGLSQIAILSEVAKRESNPGARSHLDEVARLARSLRDSMSDIVWAVDPRRDHASDLVQRMRQVAFNLFEAEGVKVELTAPPEVRIESIDLAPDRRRHLLLIFKEAVSNIARHARAKEVRIDVRLSASELALSIQDDGVGFDTSVESRGHGLASLRQRAAALNARLAIVSAPGEGTSIELSMPL